jgi:hypothetical protein
MEKTMRLQRADGQPRNVYEYQCDECGKTYTMRRQTEDVRVERLGHNVCPPCTHQKHIQAEKASLHTFPIDRRGSTKTFEFKCEVCETTWETTGASAEVSFYKANKMFLCRGCKHDRKLWDESLVEVICSKCSGVYKISEKTLIDFPNRSRRTCYRCSSKDRVTSEETKKKIAEKVTGYRHTPGSIEKIRARSSQTDMVDNLRRLAELRSAGLMPGPIAGMKQSPEWIEKRAVANRGQKRTEEFKDRMRERRNAYIERCGGHVLPETSAKMSRVQIELRQNGFNPASGHRQETYQPLKPQPAFLKPRKRPYVLSSSWESFYARWLDSNAEVVSWTYEAMSLDLPNGKTYLTDFIWEDVDGNVYMIEVKPRRKVENNVDGAQVKLEALTDFCAMMTEQTDRLWVGMLVDEDALEAIGFTFQKETIV